MRRIFLSILFSTILSSLYAGTAPIKFGKIDISQLQSTTYDKDTTAEAVVLCEYGELNTNTFTFTHIQRIKILKKSGCHRANFAISARYRNNIRGNTYNLVNGEIVTSKLKSESIFEEDYNYKYYRYKVSMPNVNVGSIIEIECTYNGIPSRWYFQRDIPVMWSELDMFTNNQIGINKNLIGSHPFYLKEDGHWICKDVPVLSSEPFTNNIKNYRTSFEFELAFVNLPGYIDEFANSWENVCSRFLQNRTLGNEMKTVLFMNEDVKRINETCKTQEEKLRAAYETIKKEIKWNEEEDIYIRPNIKTTVNTKSGNSGEINLALYLLLKRLDFNVHPIILSTKDNGMLSINLPTIDKINYMVVLVKMENKDILIDATEDFLPLGFLPERALNGKGRLLSDKLSLWVDLKAGGLNKTKSTANLSFDNEGNLSGNLQTVHSEYASYLFRKEFSEYNTKEEFLKVQKKNNPNILIAKNDIKNVDSIYMPIIIDENISYSSNIEHTDSTISFLPISIDRIESNPFMNNERKTPIDFGVESEKIQIYNFTIPNGYKVENLPTSINISLPDGKGNFLFKTSVTNNILKVSMKTSINSTIFSTQEYPLIKELFSTIIKKQNEPIILKKI